MSGTPSQPYFITTSARCAGAWRAILFTAVVTAACASTSTLFEQSYAPAERTSEFGDLRIDLRATSYRRTGVRLQLRAVDPAGAMPFAATPASLGAELAGACMLWVDELAYPARSPEPRAERSEAALYFELSRPLRGRAWLRCVDLPTAQGPWSLEMEIPAVPTQPREDLERNL